MAQPARSDRVVGFLFKLPYRLDVRYSPVKIQRTLYWILRRKPITSPGY